MKKKFKKAIAVLLALLMVTTTISMFPLTVSSAEKTEESVGATSGTTGDCTWTLDNEGTLTISGEGAMKDYPYSGAPWKELSFTKVVIEDGVTNIGNHAFIRCKGLTNITIPASVKKIGIEPFGYCYNLTDVTIPDGVMKISTDAFFCCEKLTSVTIPKSVTSIGTGAFEGCVSINSINVDEGNANYDSRNGCNAIIETKTNTLIQGCKNTVIDNSITKIGNEAFARYHSLMSITIPDSVTSIGEWAFDLCDSLTSLIIPDSVTYIGSYAFWLCTGLTSLKISNNLTNISEGAFGGLYSLKSITIPESVTYIGKEGFAYSRFTSITIPDSVTYIGEQAFECCYELTSITISEGVTNIGAEAFFNCQKLTKITIPESVTSIGNCAFGYTYGSADYYTKLDDFTISGYRGTAAEAYAYENGFTFIALDDPAIQPTTPQTEPTEPETQPTTPQTEPTQPETQPTAPQTEPTQPETQPTDPQTEPTQPEIQPTDPQTEPTQPEIQPTDPQTEPTQPETQPTDPQTEPTEPIDENAPAFEITGATAKAEETVTLDLSIKNNPGITSFRVYIDYPEDALTLTDVEFKDLFSGRASGKNSLTSPYNVLWFSADSADENCNGIIATLTFTVKENTAAGDYPITLTCSADDIFNSQFEDVSFAAVSSTVKVIEYIPGDANGDNEINMKDVVLLRQYLNEWDVEIDERALDVNRDGKINMKDIVLLQQYINDWDVVLF